MNYLDIGRDVEIGSLIDLGSWRLKGIDLTHTFGTETRPDGFYSVLGISKVPETIDSSKTSFPPLIMLVPPHLIGTHEDTNPARPETVENGFGINGFQDIGFENGWDGPPIAVLPFTLCDGNTVLENGDGLYSQLTKKLAGGRMGVAEQLAYGELLAGDGHHRRRKAIHEGLKFVPVQVIPFLHHPSVVLNTWLPDGRILTASEIFGFSRNPNDQAEAKRTKFGIIGTDGVTRRMLSAQPHVRIPLKNLK